MLAELGGKGGQVCQHAKEGKIRCPLIVRPNSEDMVTGNLFGSLQAINPRWWLPELLNTGLKLDSNHARRFRQQIYRRLRIELWQKQRFPKALVPWVEGATEVDVTIHWENPPTTVFIEMKYGSPLSSTTTNNSGDQGFPSDQLIRNARIGLHRCGWYQEDKLFNEHPRDFVLLLLAPNTGNPLVDRYRDRDTLLKSIPNSDRLVGIPKSPFIGELSYGQVLQILERCSAFMCPTERRLVTTLQEYVDFKVSTLGPSNGQGQ